MRPVHKMAMPKKHELPSRSQMARNALKAAGELFQKGFKVASKEEQSERISICEQCEFFKKDQQRCVKCGCHLQWKTRMKSWSCPLKKW